MPEPINVLFVCLGNICRSPMAEAVFHSHTHSNPRIARIDSCGTGAYHTLEPPDPRTLATLRRHGITDYTHGARKVEMRDFEEFDWIFAMDRHNLHDLERMRRRAEKEREKKGGKGEGVRARVALFGRFGGKKEDGDGEGEEVVDPYYGRDNGFEVVFEQVGRFSEGFLREVLGDGGEEGDGEKTKRGGRE